MFYPQKIFHLLGFPSWKSSDPKIMGIKTYLLENFSQKKGSRKFLMTFLGKTPLKMGNCIYHFLRCSKILGEAGKQEIFQKMFRKF